MAVYIRIRPLFDQRLIVRRLPVIVFIHIFLHSVRGTAAFTYIMISVYTNSGQETTFILFFIKILQFFLNIFVYYYVWYFLCNKYKIKLYS